MSLIIEFELLLVKISISLIPNKLQIILITESSLALKLYAITKLRLSLFILISLILVKLIKYLQKTILYYIYYYPIIISLKIH
ncbi:hypothetical protein SDC9_118379 [bioreactor metagenome]|uniref:Uncharacterized protein n=1 Tax=bioreactor metagenome TaxID=1076179 RepID=A0A645C8W2_9ZZZZ